MFALLRFVGGGRAATVAALGVFATGAILPPRALSNFPVTLDGAVRQPVAVADLDGDGRNEIVVDAADAVVVVSDDGQLVPGFPVPAAGRLAGPPAVGDVDGDGRREILAVTQAGRVLALHADGTPVPGFPRNLKVACRAGGSLLDLDRDGRDELVVGCNDGRLHAWRPAASEQAPVTELQGYPVRVGAEITSSATLADLGAETAAWTLLVGAADGGVHAFRRGGERVRGFPVRSRYLVSGAPASGDLDGDGVAEVIFTSQDYHVYAADASGKVLPGFPVAAGYRIYGGPALVDLTGDRLPEIAFAGSDRKLYAVDRRGRPLEGFPVALDDEVPGGAVAGDVDRDGQNELLVATSGGQIHAFGPHGAPVPGWPVRVTGRFAGSPVLADVVGDGAVEVVAGTLEGTLVAYKAPRRGDAPLRLAWPAEAHDPGRSGRRFPNPARFLDLAVLPEDARSTQALSAGWRYVDPDREPEGEVELRWYRDGAELAELRGAREIPADRIKEEERWHFTLRAVKDGPDARVFSSPELTVRNAPPTAPTVRLAPDAPRTLDELKVEVVRASEDPDGDALSYRYRWFVDGRPVDDADADRLASKRTRKRQVWAVVVRAFDGTDVSEPAEASVRVLNTAPSVPSIALQAAEPAVTDPIRALIRQPSTDPDGDEITYRYRWRVAGEDAGLAESVDEVPAGLARKTDRVEVTVHAFDGTEEGGAAQASAVVHNTAPGEPTVTIRPQVPATGTALLAAVERPAADPDDDPVRYTFAWSLDGAPAEVEGDTVPADRVHAGQRWTVKVRAHDDDGPGGGAEAAVGVPNAPPVAPVVAIEPPSPLPEQPLQAVIRTPASDRDGHPVSLTWVWSVDGKRALEGESVPAGRVRKNERWTVTVTPNDGRVDGPAARATVVVGNRPPPAPAVVLEPASPTGAQSIRAKVALAADPDGDRLTPRYRWTLDGERVPDLDDAEQVPADRVRRDQVWAVKAFADDGDDRSPAAAATVRVRDRAPSAPQVRVRPEAPRTIDELVCEVSRASADPDGEPVTTLLQWFRDGTATAHSGDTLPASATRKGQRWSCRGIARAGGAEVVGERSGQVSVANSPPTPPQVRIEPPRPVTGAPLRCGVSRASADADGDRISYTWAWKADGRARPELKGPVVPGEQVKKGQRWSCSVQPSDGADAGERASAESEVGNTPPVPPRIRLVPERPLAGQDLMCEIVEDATDSDGDRLSYQYRWYLEDEHQPFALTSVEVRGRLVESGARWRCGVAATDGADVGPEAFSETVYVGDAPQEASASR